MNEDQEMKNIKRKPTPKDLKAMLETSYESGFFAGAVAVTQGYVKVVEKDDGIFDLEYSRETLLDRLIGRPMTKGL